MNKAKFASEFTFWFRNKLDCGYFIYARSINNPRVINANRCSAYGRLLTYNKHSQYSTKESWMLTILVTARSYKELRRL